MCSLHHDPSLLTPRSLATPAWRRLCGALALAATAALATSTLAVAQDPATEDPAVEAEGVEESKQVPDAGVARRSLRALERKHGDSAFGQLELARAAQKWGLDREMWQHLDACIELQPDGSTARRLDAMLAQLAPAVAGDDAQAALAEGESIDAVVRRLVRKARMGRGAKVRALEHALAGMPSEATEALRKQARSAGSPLQRMTALHALAKRGDEGDARFVLRSAILDTSPEVRQAAMTTPEIRENSGAAIDYLVPGLHVRDPKMKERTADAFAALGDLSAVPHLVAAGQALMAPLPGGSTRGYMAVTTQQAYIRDFDVEVAQAAFIADPKIDVLQTGVVLDVAVHAVTAQRVRLRNSYRRAIRNLVGVDPGENPAAWGAWLGSMGDKIPHRPAPTTGQGR